MAILIILIVTFRFDRYLELCPMIKSSSRSCGRIGATGLTFGLVNIKAENSKNVVQMVVEDMGNILMFHGM